MNLPVNYWLETIADDVIRESALRQWDKCDNHVENLFDAILFFCWWDKTKEGVHYWQSIIQRVFNKTLKLRDYITPDGELIFTAETGTWSNRLETDPLTTHIYEVTKAIELLKNEGYLIFKPNSNL